MEPRGESNLGEALLDLFEQQGCVRIDTPILQPAELFLDLSGEDIRRRLFLTQDANGAEFCLRPEWTIPVCRQHLAAKGDTAKAGSAKEDSAGARAVMAGAAEAGQVDYCYLGPVFRHRDEGSGEFIQAGAESIGREDVDAADADTLGFGIDGFVLARGETFRGEIGDMGLLEAVLSALDVAPSGRRRLIRALAAGTSHADALAWQPAAAGADYSGLLSAIEGQDSRAARLFVEDVIRIAGVTSVGGRSAGEIADRFLSKAENRSGALPDRAREVLGRYLQISGDLDDSADALRRLARDERLPMAEVLDRFEDRIGFVAARGADLSRLRFAADFVRTLDYYTGMIFELRDESQPAGPLLVGGGRYDRLLDHLGGTGPIPAVGCSFWLDRLAVATP